MSDKHTPIFLGIARMAAHHGHDLNIVGLSYSLFFPFFPQTLFGLMCIIGIHIESDYSDESIKLFASDLDEPRNEASCQIRITFQKQSGSDLNDTTAYFLFPIPCPPLAISKPTVIKFDVEIDSVRTRLGEVNCIPVEPPPMSEEERRAIASRIGSAKSIIMELQCKECGEILRFYALLDPSEYPYREAEKKGATYIETLPDSWKCKCGIMKLNLQYAKAGIHDIFRRPFGKGTQKELSFIPLYQQGHLRKVYNDFQSLITSNPEEETVQKFIENSPVIWAFLSPLKILHKPSVLTKKKADFGIMSNQNILYLIELEKPQTPVATKTGGLHAELQKGFNQVRDWNIVVENHRYALLEQLGFQPNEVLDIRYILVAGQSCKVHSEELAKIQRSLPSKTTFYCYDELCSFLLGFEKQIEPF